ncbi:MAG: molybdopterin-dependent oxidoreductase [Chloroflexi bacterium]|nr:molybdopterin-dependent oxidoreductase [Chloroflexota bacterium]
MAISFTLNGRMTTVAAPPDRSLLQVLRDELRITGTKKACDGGECGSCTVLVDGKAAMSCRLPLGRMEGRSVMTIEGLGTPEKLHPLQQAFVDLGAVQCGYCTPGMIMQSLALLLANPNPSREEVVRRLSRNLCRCTGYVRIVEAVLYAAHLMRGGERRSLEGGVVGARVERVDARDKVTGRALYATDVFREGMLYARVLWSPHQHARILKVSEAERQPGVVAVLTAGDIPGTNTMRPGLEGWPLLAQGRVCYVGDPVAVVVADSEDRAGEAVGRIKVDYQVLPAVFDPVEALKEDAPQVSLRGNLDYTRRIVKGSVEEGFRQADAIVENTYITPFQEHAYMEPDAALAFLDSEGRVVVQACTQWPHASQAAIANILGIETEKVRVMPTLIGGGFGGKYVEFCWLAAALATFKTRRPVKLVLTREECFIHTKKRHAFQIRLRTGATKDGKLTALQAELIGNSGAYPTGTPVTQDFPMAVVHVTGPYEVPHVLVEGKAVATNVPKSGAFRGLGGIQICWAWESQMDLLAAKLGIDPWELRYRNALQVGSATGTGQVLTESVGLKKTLEAIKPYYQQALASLTNSEDRRRGVGLGCMWRGYGGQMGGEIEAHVELLPDGKVQVATSGVEMGQGLWTVMSQIAAQELGVPLEAITLISGDTLLTSQKGSGTSGSKTTYLMGNAVHDGARKLKAFLLREAAEVLEEKVENIRLEDGYLFSALDPSQRLSLERLAAISRGKGLSTRQTGIFDYRFAAYLDPETGQGSYCYLYAFSTQMAEVEVNTATGEVKVLRVVSADDVGRVIHPPSLEGQIHGGIMQGLGYTLMEDFIPGKSRSFKDYPIPTTRHMPEMITMAVEEPVTSGPFGAKGAGESAVVAPPAAIVNAIAHAIGTRVYRLPAVPQRVLDAIAKGDSAPT